MIRHKINPNRKQFVTKVHGVDGGWCRLPVHLLLYYAHCIVACMIVAVSAIQLHALDCSDPHGTIKHKPFSKSTK
jgi:hypothetical protein